MYKIIDLFAGAGGLSLGFQQTGKFNIVMAAENNPTNGIIKTVSGTAVADIGDSKFK